MEIEEIRTEDLFHHPDNPRTEYGDIEELTDSIREKGILQPLTVVKLGKYIDRYNVVAGNRRLEAAKTAGLKTCPCIIADISEKDQAAIMLIENMQQKNLTPYEEGRGVQMCLDLGISEEDLAKKTGFSRDTIRHRKRLAELDQEKLRNKCNNGQVSINDLIKLEQIKDIEERNKLLESVGTRDFNYNMQNSLRNQEIKENITKARLKLETFAEEVNADWYDNTFEIVAMYIADDDFEIPDDSDEREYVFQHPSYSTSSYKLYGKKVEKDDNNDEDAPMAAEAELRIEIREKLEEEQELIKSTRREFMKTTEACLDAESVIRWLIFLVANDEEFDAEGFKGLSYLDIDSDIYEEVSGRQFKNILGETGNRQLREATRFIYSALELPNYHRLYHDWNNKWQEDNEADMLYKFLEELGYEMCESERKFQAGTHELFDDEEEE